MKNPFFLEGIFCGDFLCHHRAIKNHLTILSTTTTQRLQTTFLNMRDVSGTTMLFLEKIIMWNIKTDIQFGYSYGIAGGKFHCALDFFYRKAKRCSNVYDQNQSERHDFLPFSWKSNRFIIIFLQMSIFYTFFICVFCIKSQTRVVNRKENYIIAG